jgi:formylglycine-generating enzyme required for sulfatase activity
VATLAAVFRDPRPEFSSERSLAASLLADYAAADAHALADLQMDADEKQFPAIFAKLKNKAAAALPELVAEINRSAPAGATDAAKERLAKRQANAAVAMLRLNQPQKAWALLKHSKDPRARSYLIHRFAPLGADPAAIVRQLNVEPDATVRRALILSLGEFDQKQWRPADLTGLIENLLVMYEKELDPGVHAATEWLLRQWGRDTQLATIGSRLGIDDSGLETALTSNLTVEQQRRLTELSADVSQIQARLADAEATLPARQAAWEQDVVKGPAQDPSTMETGLIVHYPIHESGGNQTTGGPQAQPGDMYEGAGNPHWEPGVAGRALALDGNGSIATGRPLDLECDHPFSYGCWFQHTGDPPMVLISTRNEARGYRGFDLSLENAHQLRVQISAEVPATPDSQREAWSNFLITVIATTGVDPVHSPGWHHVIATYDGSKRARGVKIYVDGQVQPTRVLDDNIVGTIKSEAPVYIGSRYGYFRFKGKLDDVRIYNRELAEADVGRLYELGVKAVARVAAADRTAEQRRLVAGYYRRLDEPLHRLDRDLGAARASLQKTAAELVTGRWYVNGQGQTMVVIPGPVEFEMGSPTDEAGRQDNETRHKRRIGRTFALAAKPVTADQYRRFDAAYQSSLDMPDLPVAGTSWYQAAQYCNWLSEQEQIPEDQWCYRMENGQVTALKQKYLSLTGYRLPTEAEIEFATRAGAITSRYYGETDELLDKYAWYSNSSGGNAWPVGSKKPNDLGFFDLLGNIWCWCQDSYVPYPSLGEGEVAEDNEGSLSISATASRMLRCGSFNSQPSDIRSASRGPNAATIHNFDCGFRAARTLWPDSAFPRSGKGAPGGRPAPAAGTPAAAVTNRDQVESKLRPMLAARRSATTTATTQPNTMFWFDFRGDPHLWTQVDATHWEESYPQGSATRFLVEKEFSEGGRTGTLVCRDDFEVLVPLTKEGQPLLCRRKPTDPWQNLGPIHLVAAK